MQLNAIFIAMLMLAGCKEGDNMDVAPFVSPNVSAGYETLAKGIAPNSNQPLVAASALNALANIFANGGNYVIDASSLGGGVLVGKNGQVSLPNNNAVNGKAILSQLINNVRVPPPQEHSAPLAADLVSKSRPTATIIQHSIPATTSRPYPISIAHSFPMPVVKTIYVPKYFPVPISRPYLPRISNLISNNILLKILETNPDDYDDDFY